MHSKFVTLLAFIACVTSAPFDFRASESGSPVTIPSFDSSHVAQVTGSLTMAPSATKVHRNVEDELPSSLKHIAIPLQEIIDKMDVNIPTPLTSITPSESFATPIVTPTQPLATTVNAPSLFTSAASSTITAPPTSRAIHRRHINFNPMGRILSAIYGEKMKSENMAKEEEDEEEDEWDEWTAQPTKTVDASALQQALKGAAKELAAASAALIEVLDALEHETITSHESGSGKEDDDEKGQDASASSTTLTVPMGSTTVLPKEIVKQIEDSL